MNIPNLLSLCSLIVGIMGILGAVYISWSNALKKQYASERDFGHIRKNQEQISQGLAHIDDEIRASTEHILERLSLKIERIDQQLNDVKALLLAHLNVNFKKED